MGGRSQNQLERSYAAGADDYLNIGMSSHDLGVRLQRLLNGRRLSEARSDTDPVAGTGNRSATERSLDRLRRVSTGNGEPFALALVTIDHFEQIRSTEGTAVGDAIVRLLGARLLGAFQGEDVAGRWTDDGFAVGIHGATREEASERITRVLDALTAEGVSTTSGDLAHYTFSAGVASAPADGSSLASLERICETALRRATASQNSVVISGERPAHDGSDVVDVVLIEDDDSMADVIEHAVGLRQYGFKRFSDGADAATALGQGTVKAKVVLLDVGLPSLDGFGVLQVLRSQGILDETRVIMLTARSSEGEVLRAIDLGATEHITKPFSIPVLLARLDQTQRWCRGMSAVDLVVTMLIVIGSAIAAVLVTVWVSSLVQAHRVRIEPTLGEARQAIIAALSGGPQESDDALANLSRFSERYIVSVMLDLAPSVSGSSRSVLVVTG